VNRPILARLSLWQKYERMLLETVQEALELLIDIAEDDGEVSINEKLYRALLETDKRRYRRGEPVLDQGPIYDAQMGPADPAWAAANRTRPDIRWDLQDHLAESEAVQILPFVVECKRLRRPSDHGWVFNKAYVVHGVKRFASITHRYGANASGGVLVGYWQNMEYEAVLGEVNAALTGEGYDVISLTPVSARLGRSSQQLNRPFEVSPFHLRHYWIDVRTKTSTGDVLASEAQSAEGAPDDVELAEAAIGGDGQNTSTTDSADGSGADEDER
jgi:hypothetical protein